MCLAPLSCQKPESAIDELTSGTIREYQRQPKREITPTVTFLIDTTIRDQSQYAGEAIKTCPL